VLHRGDPYHPSSLITGRAHQVGTGAAADHLVSGAPKCLVRHPGAGAGPRGRW